ncbi:MAG: sensor histidine kinase [Limisphaerales bacterium]
MVKEALNNVVKYSSASEVKISLPVMNAILFISIANNAKGFSMEKVSSFGNGLQNMRERIENLGGKFSLISGSGNGTRVRLEIPSRR